MKSVSQSAWRLAVFTLVMLALLLVIIQAIKRPVAGATETYNAVFTDANGLKPGDDVRMFGVQVGAVESIVLHNSTQAKVRISVQRGRPIYDNTTLAIRYQNLTGQRFVDIQQPSTLGRALRPKTTITDDHTVPSFDITSLFNGLQPVLADFSPDDLNQFTSSMLAVIDGNGTGLGPALAAIEKLSDYVTDRQTVISTLIGNLRQIDDHIGGQSPQLKSLIGSLNAVFGTVVEKIDGLIDFAETAPPVLRPIDSLLATLGLTAGPNADLDKLVHTAFPDPQQSVDVLSRLPGLVQSLTALIPTPASGIATACSHGASPLPTALRILIGGQKLTICNK